MRIIILVIFAICMAGTVKGQYKDSPWYQGPTVLKPSKGGLQIIINDGMISFSNDQPRSVQFAWADATNSVYLYRGDSKRKHKKILKRMNEKPYTWVKFGQYYYKYNRIDMYTK